MHHVLLVAQEFFYRAFNCIKMENWKRSTRMGNYGVVKI